MTGSEERKIFEGYLEYFSKKTGGICVDWFKPFRGELEINSMKYFISHAHTDHIPGIQYKFLKELKSGSELSKFIKIYCTEITYEIIAKLHSDFIDLKSHFVFLQSSGVKDIYLTWEDGEPTGDHLTVRTIPANHIPGAVMFLFSDGVKRCLYTGDFRYDTRDDNWEMSILRQFAEGYMETIDFLYVDVTCLDLGRIYSPEQNKLPNRTEMKDKICELIDDQAVKHIHIDVSSVGSETLVAEVARHLSVKKVGIKHGDRRKSLLEYMLGREGLNVVELNQPDSKIKLHVSSQAVFKGNDINGNCGLCAPHTLRIRATLKWAYVVENDYQLDDSFTWMKYDKEHDYYKALISHHSSNFEVREFVSFLRFREIHPISIPLDRSLHGVPCKVLMPAESPDKKEFLRKYIYLSFVKRPPSFHKKHSVLQFSSSGTHETLQSDFWFDVYNFFAYRDDYDYDILDIINKYQDLEYYFSVVISCRCLISANRRRMIPEFLYHLIKFPRARIIFTTTNAQQENWAGKTIKSEVDKINDRKLGQYSLQRIFYVDLTHILKDRDNLGEIPGFESSILKETLKNTVRNYDKQVEVPGWPVPFHLHKKGS